MKKRIAFLCLFLLAVSVFCSCSLLFPEFEFTFVLGDGRENVTAYINATSELYIPEPKEQGTVFGGWYVDEACKEPYLLRRHTEGKTLYALWLSGGERVLTLVYGDGRENTHLIFQGEVPPVSEPYREGYVFDYWKDSATGRAVDLSTLSRTVTVLEAVWSKAVSTAKVTVVYGQGTDDASTEVKTGLRIEAPEPPVRVGYSFCGWYKDPDFIIPFDFSKPILSDTTLYARWEADYSLIVNSFTTEVVKSSVKISIERVKKDGYTQVRSATTGSGVVFYRQNNVYYCLTNYHVVAKEDALSVDRAVFDCYGNRYGATLVYESAQRDLAVLKFSSPQVELAVAELAAENAEIGSTAVSVGNPGGLFNSVTFGEVLRYEVLEIDESSIDFPVGWHTAPIDRGSSGGAVFNYDGLVIGINYAGSTDENDEFEYGFFIPISEVYELLYELQKETGIDFLK